MEFFTNDLIEKELDSSETTLEELKQWLVDEKANPRVMDGMKELIGLNDEVKETSYNVESSAIELSDAIMKLDKVLNPDMFNDEDMLDLDEVDYSTNEIGYSTNEVDST